MRTTDRAVTPELVRSALSFLSPDLPNDDWVRVGMSIKSEFPDETGLDLFDEWSAGGDAYQERDVRARWRSFKAGGRVTIGTLFGLAKDQGFTFPKDDAPAAAPDPAKLAAEKAKREAARELEAAQWRARADDAAREARKLWAAAAQHGPCPYAARKNIGLFGVRVLQDGTLLVPMVNTAGELMNVQRIAAVKPEDGPDKRFLPGGRKTALMHVLGKPLASVPVALLAEGYATAASIHYATGHTVVVTFDAGNMVAVAKALREVYPELPLLMCADDDRETAQRTGRNPGVEKAEAAARAAAPRSAVVLPKGLPPGGTDFNDLQAHADVEAVEQCIQPAIATLLNGPPPQEEASFPPGETVAPAAPRRGEGAAPKTRRKPKVDQPSDAEKERDDAFYAQVDTLAERFALIYGTDTVWDNVTQMIVRVPALRLALGKAPVNAWLNRASRRMVLPTELVFEPGQQVPEPQINMFCGLPVKPRPCADDEVAPMLALLRHLCSESADTADGVDQVMHWVLCWQALPLQQLGTKMQSACVFHGAQGTGKNLYWDMWRDLYGGYGITVGQTEIEDKFNGWISRKLAIIGDEVVSRAEMYHNKNRLKLVVTQEEKFAIRGMMQETRWESNHANVVFLSNESQPLALEERDRRYLVVYTPLEADLQVYQAVRDFKARGGLAKWLYYLQNYPVGDFGAHTKPLMTRAKEALIQLGWRPPERFAHEWLSGVIDLPVRVCSAEQLYRAFRRWSDMVGERWPPSQAIFSSQVNRWAKERVGRDASGRREEPALVYKDGIALRHESGSRKTVRCWVPRGSRPLPGVSEGEWAAESVRAFENDLHRFTRRFVGGQEVEE